MPGASPLGQEICNGTSVGANGATSLGTSVSPSATANTKGSYAQLAASTGIDACLMIVEVAPTSGLGAYSIDIAIGGAGSEVVIAPNLVVQNAFSLTIPHVFVVPVQIPAGTRIAARCQSATASDSAIAVTAQLFAGSFSQMEGAAGVEAIGFVSASTQGTTIDAGGTANTKGAYVQLTASAARDYVGFFFVVDNLNANSSLSSNAQLLDIAIGGAGSEVVIEPNYQIRRNNSGIAVLPPVSPIFAAPIPAGSRIAARSQSETNSSPSRSVGLTLYGIY